MDQDMEVMVLEAMASDQDMKVMALAAWEDTGSVVMADTVVDCMASGLDMADMVTDWEAMVEAFTALVVMEVTEEALVMAGDHLIL